MSIAYGINTLTDIANYVLLSLGQPKIADIDDTSDSIATRIKSVIQLAIGEVQTSIIWPECSDTVEISSTGNQDVNDFYEFLLPSDHLRTISCDAGSDWYQRNNYIYASADSDITIKYLRYSEDVAHYSIQMLDLIYLTAAVRVARSLHTDAGVINSLMKEMQMVKADLQRQVQHSARPVKTRSYSSRIYSARGRVGYRG